jgi:hypothetical protein
MSICPFFDLTIALEAAIIRAWLEGDRIMGGSRSVDVRKLVVLSGRTKGTAFFLTKPQVKAGRESDNAICLKGKRVSRYHAVLVRNNGEYTLRDVSPRLGTLLNGRPTKEAPLKLGDRIRIGEFEMSYEAATAPAICSPSATTPSQRDELTAPRFQVAAKHKKSVAELAAENSAAEHQRRIAELTQETERLVGELNLANKALESLRAQLQTRSDLQPDLTERISTVSQENAALAMLNSELQAKISELEASAGEADRVETELAVAQVALRQMSEDLVKAREDAVIAKRCVSDQTNEEFDRIRRSLVAKQSQKPDKSIAPRLHLSRFLRPFRVTARTARIS